MIAVFASSGVAFLAAVLAFLGVMRTVSQKERTDRRDQWWKRVQWAADLVRSEDDAAQQIGLAALEAMIDEAGKITPTDGKLLQGIIEVVLGTGDSQGGRTDASGGTAGHPSEEGGLDDTG